MVARLGWDVDQRCVEWWRCRHFGCGVFTGFKVAEPGHVIVELGVGHTVDVGDVPVVSEDT